MKFKHGTRVTCKIQDTEITDARISVDDGGQMFICQNYKDGAKANDKLGYKYSWDIGRYCEEGEYNVFNLRVIDEDILFVKYGDIVENKMGKRKVLGVCGDIVHLSMNSEHRYYMKTCTMYELKKYGYKLEDDDRVEISVDGKVKRISRYSAIELGLIKKGEC